MSVKISNKQLIELWREGTLTVRDVTYAFVEEGDWDGAGEKYQTLEVIFTDGERNYSGCITRSGSYFSDWNYDDYGDADIDEVERVTRTITVKDWQPVLERGYQVYEAEYPEEGYSFLAESDLPRPEYTVIGPAVRTKSGWHALKEAAN